jgi:hypothetical protein
LESTFLCVEDEAGAEYFVSFFIVHEETPQVIFLAVLKEFLVLHFIFLSFSFLIPLYHETGAKSNPKRDKTDIWDVTFVTLKILLVF